MSTPKLINCDIGGFTLRVAGYGQFAVQDFQLTKEVGKLGSCTVHISDCTQKVNANPSSYPKKMGNIKKLFDQTQKIQNTGTLPDVALIQYNSNSTKTWFIGKLCTLAPVLQSTYGIYAGLQCFCLSKACQLMYSPIADFVYVPSNMSTQVQNLRTAGVFDNKIIQAAYAASNKNLAQNIASYVSASDTILQMLDKVLKKSLQRKNTRGQLLKVNQGVDLNKYFDCDLRLSNLLLKQSRDTQHPYVLQFVKDLFNGFQQAPMLDAITATLNSSQRCLTYIPASIKEAGKGYDKLKIWPSYIQPSKTGAVQIAPDQMLSCTISSAPLQHLRTPTLLFVRAKKASMWQSQTENMQSYQRYMGSYLLPGARPPYRFQVLDIPSWVLGIVGQMQVGNLQHVAPALMNSKSLSDIKARVQNKTRSSASQIYKDTKKLLDQVAKTKFFNTYMMTKFAQVKLAVTQATINIDGYLGRSIAVTIPVHAQQLGGAGQKFYGRLQNVTYKFTAAQSPRAKSTLDIACGLSGITSVKSPAAAVYTSDDPSFIYKRG